MIHPNCVCIKKMLLATFSATRMMFKTPCKLSLSFFFFRIGDINFLFIFIFFSMADSTMIFSSHWLQFCLSVYETEWETVTVWQITPWSFPKGPSSATPPCALPCQVLAQCSSTLLCSILPHMSFGHRPDGRSGRLSSRFPPASWWAWDAPISFSTACRHPLSCHQTSHLLLFTEWLHALLSIFFPISALRFTTFSSFSPHSLLPNKPPCYPCFATSIS